VNPVAGVVRGWEKFSPAGTSGHRCKTVGDTVHVRYLGHERREADELKRYTLILTNVGYVVEEEGDEEREGRRRLVVKDPPNHRKLEGEGRGL
jgi:hypothetical protein